MNIEIKFRGKRESNGEWVYGGFVQFNKYSFIFPDPSIEYWDRYVVDPNTVGQFTGEVDVNGKKIYENDIVKFRTKRFHYKDESKKNIAKWKWFKSVVMFNDGSFLINESGILRNATDVYNYDTYLSAFTKDSSNCIEVIGNIHDNPELLDTK